MIPCVLVVDDDATFRSMLGRVLSRRGFRVDACASAEEALERTANQRVDVVLTDVVMTGMDGLEMLVRLRASNPEIPVVVMSGSAGLDVALRAIREGAHDFLEKPTPEERLVVTLENAVRYSKLARRNEDLERTSAPPLLSGGSARIESLTRIIAKVAPSDGRVLILGENGTGKELVASALHHGSPRSKGPFIKLNCAAVPAELVESELFGHERGAFTGAVQSRRGRFEMAEGGTLFLDEIGDMPAAMQAKLLRVLQEGSFERIGGARPIDVDVRVIAATHRNLPRMVDDGTFREDLYYRLNVVTIEVPPLRDRRDDIAVLAEHFLSSANRKLTFSPNALRALEGHDWPGNVRELSNLVERLAILAEGSSIGATEVEAQLRGARRGPAKTLEPISGEFRALYRAGATYSELVDDAERAILKEALAAHDGNKAATARALHMDRSNFHKKLRQLSIE
jgi:DNA-binding NtrC family response regulator